MERILVTGSSGGFGKLITRLLKKKGHTVAAALRDRNVKNRLIADEFESEGIHVVEMDVTSDDSVIRGVDKAISLAGGVDIVVNNAGAGAAGFQESFTAQDWLALFEINVFGVQRVNRGVLPYMRDQGSGLLIHISSLLGRIVLPFMGPYCASKFALEALADTYRVELSSVGIESIIVEPGGYGTGFEKHLMMPSDVERKKGYGPISHLPEIRMEAFASTLQGPDSPDPQMVADAVAALVEMPRGQRPFRTTVDKHGMGQVIESYNKDVEEIQEKLYRALGIGEMLNLKL